MAAETLAPDDILPKKTKTSFLEGAGWGEARLLGRHNLWAFIFLLPYLALTLVRR